MESLLDLARHQHGLVSRRQAVDIVTAEPVRRRLRTGRLESVRHGVSRVAGVPYSWLESVMPACLAAPGSAASFRCAAQLWGLEGCTDEKIETRSRLETVGAWTASRCTQCGHRTLASHERRDPGDIARPPLCDLTAVAPSWTVEHAVDAALRKQLVTLRALARIAESLEGRGRHRCTVMREILEHRLPGYHPGKSEPDVCRLSVARDTRSTHVRKGES